MPIQVECSSCRAAFKVEDDFAGKRGKCPRCKATITVPAGAARVEVEEAETYALHGKAPKARAVPVSGAGAGAEGSAMAHAAEAARPTRATQTPARILAAFRDEIEPVRPTALYRLWIVIVAGMMVLLPLAYLAIVGGVIYALVLHAVHDLVIFQNVRNVRAALFLYAGPLVVGGMVVAFMLKPLFAKPGRREKAKALDASKEPLIFAFVDGVCTSVGAPTPSRIEIDCDVNASAHRASGPLGIFGNDLVLTIGLPLVAGLTLPQFAGVLAHEFGHFSQGAGMRLSGLIRTINAWFARVVYERDEWDETLVEWSSGGNGTAMVVAGLARVAVWLTRRILWVLMMVGHAVSCILSRQMEFDADRYEARMVGGAVFAQTMTRLGELNLASRGAYADILSSWQERRLPDDLPKLILANVPQIPESVRAAFLDAQATRSTGVFDTHPADKDRVARAEAEGPEGIFRLDGPATDLFRDFDALSRSATLGHYRAILGPQVSKEQLYPVVEAVHGVAANQQGHEAYGRFFLEGFGALQALPLPESYPVAPPDLKAAKRALMGARADMTSAREANLAALERWNELHNRATEAEAATALLKAGNRIKAADFGLDEATEEAAESAGLRAESALRKLAGTLEPFEVAASRRLFLALGLLESDAVASRVPDGPARRDEARALYPCAVHLGHRLAQELPPMLRARQALGSLCETFQKGNNAKNPTLINAILRAGSRLSDRLHELRWKIGDTIAYPFEHAQAEMTLARFILPPVLPQKDEIAELLQVSDQAVEKLLTLHRRVLGRLAVTAEEVERTVGLSPLAVEQPAAPA